MDRATRDGSRMRIVLHDELASGGTATVHIGCLLDPSTGIRTVVAVKRLKEGATDPELVTMLFDEARCARRIRHPNVVPILDVVSDPSGVMLAFEYVHGETLSRLSRACLAARGRIPPGIAAAIMTSVLEGLDAAHEATDVDGTPLRIVHRDVSPQNVMLGDDGIPRVVDFGIAKAVGRLRTTRDGTVRGKIGYLAPEQLSGKTTRQSDVFSTAVVLWELLAGRRLYLEQEPVLLLEAMKAPPPAPSSIVPDLPPALDRVVLRGLARDVGARYATAGEMARDLAASIPLADRAALAAFVAEYAGVELQRRAALVAAVLEGRAPSSGGAAGAARETAALDAMEATEPVAGAGAAHAVSRAPAASPSPALSSPSRSRAAWSALAAFVVLVLAGVGALRMRATSTGPVTTPAPSDSAASSSPPRASSAASPSATATAETTTQTTTEAEPADAGSDRERAANPRARTPPGRRGQHPASLTVDCDPPYTLSEDGARRIPKRECLR